MKFALVPTALLTLAGAAALVAVPSIVRAEDAPHEAVEKLMPELLSDDDAVRGEAERRLFALGDAGRAELERVARDSDPRRAITAVRLLGSSKWRKTASPSHRTGELRAEREEGEDAEDASTRFDDLTARMQKQLDDLRRRVEQFGGGFDLKLPQVRAFTLPGAALNGIRGAASGSVVENDRKTSWSVDEEGRVKVTLKDGEDAPETTYEAKSFDELKAAHPDVAARVEPMLGGGPRVWSFGGSPGQFRAFTFGNGGNVFERSDLFAEARQSTLGVEWSPVPDVLREQIEMPAGGIVVENVVDGSLAERLGIRRHDVLVEVQGESVKGSGDVKAALRRAKKGDSVKAVVIRKGQRHTLESTK